MQLIKSYSVFVSSISVITTFASFFFTAKDIGFVSPFALSLIFLVVLTASYFVFWIKANRLSVAELSINGTNVEVVTGDIFDQFDNQENHKDEISVIPVNEYYDYIVDDNLIAGNTLHGQYINKIKAAGKLDKLNSKIENDLYLKKTGEPKVAKEREKGRKVKYNIGSMVEFENYILTAFTNFDDRNEAFVTADSYIDFWMTFWKNIGGIYNGKTINIPLIGAGITRFNNGKPTKQQLLEVMLLSMKISGFQNTYNNKKIRFIIYFDDASEINFYAIKHSFIF